MDAYSDYLLQLSEQRLADLRREATEARLARSLAANGGSRARRGSGLRARLAGRSARRAPAGPMPVPVPLPRSEPDAVVTGLRRSA